MNGLMLMKKYGQSTDKHIDSDGEGKTLLQTS